MKIKINILFWQDNEDSQRLNNVNLSWFYLKKFVDYAKTKELDIDAFLWDFSPSKVLGDAIHIPYEKGSYKRSAKINEVIKYHANEDCFFSIIDSDLIFIEEDYDTLIYLLKKMKEDKFYVFRVQDLQSLDGVDYENKNIDFSQVKANLRNYEPDLGGCFFCSNKLFKICGLFNEEFIVWGGEDCDLSYRFQEYGYKKVLLPVEPYHLPHTNLMEKTINTEQYKKQVEILFQGRR